MEQMTLMPIREPCNRICECEWGSLVCIEKNGFMRDYRSRKWLRDENGKILMGRGECDYYDNRSRSSGI